MEYLDENELMTIRRRLAAGQLASRDFGATEPLRPHMLGSAVGRQTAGLGDYRKYDTVSQVAATLFYGLALNHPFENGNKRTALVAMLVLLQQNRTLLTGTTEDDLYDMATDMAGHKFPLPLGIERTPDSEVAALGAWIRERTRPLERGDRTMTFREFRAQMEAQGCWFGAPTKNSIKIFRATSDGERAYKMGYPRANFEVDVKIVKRVRRVLALDEANGFDSGAFYEDDLDAVVDGFVNTYRHVLDRLALT